MAGKHTGPRREHLEYLSWLFANHGVREPLTGKRHVTCAPAIIRAEYHRWLNSTERAYARKEELSG